MEQPEASTSNSISFVVTTENDPAHSDLVLDAVTTVAGENDEIILLTRADRMAEVKPHRQTRLRVIGLPDPTVFSLRANVPAAAQKEWIVVLEEHSLVTPATLTAIREMIRSRHDVDLIAFLGKNLTSTGPWGWANFLHTFALIWAPIANVPPFAPVTAAVIRRSAIGTDEPLREGEWEFELVPRLFASGRYAYSNEIYVDHVKVVNVLSCLLLAFHNARAGSGISRALGRSARDILREGKHVFLERPQQLAAAIVHRKSELPWPMQWRLRAVGLAHLIGNVVGAFLGPGRSGHKLD